MTDIRSDHERICNEIQTAFAKKMGALRTRMQAERVKAIKKIETTKNAKIRECTQHHEKKYSEIKEYYNEITSTNLDLIKFLKEDLATSKAEEQ